MKIRNVALVPLAFLVALLPATVLNAQGTRSTILTNGPVANRINIAILSEGYTTNQLPQFLTDATNLINNLLSASPYAEYRGYFNAFAISIASAQSGSDHPSSGTVKNTHFNSSYDSSFNYVITIPSDATGVGKVNSLLQSLVPEYDLAILLVNDPAPGGSGITPGGSSLTNLLTTALNLTSPDIAVHESGHALAGLADEYTNANPGFSAFAERPNVTQQTNRALVKWRVWIDDATPVPTPAAGYESVVGVFRGAQYSTNWYRPEFDCKMRSINPPAPPFCEVCSEALVKTIYQSVRPIESFNPAYTNVTITSTQAVAFSVSTLQPQTHDLTVQWLVDDNPVVGATNNAFTLLPSSLTNGIHVLKAQVRDATAQVRNDPAGLLTQSVSWRLDVSVTDLRLISPLWLAGGQFTFCVTGSAPQGFLIQASTNLVDWTTLSTNQLTAGKFNHTNAAPGAQRFFRAAAP